jgi:hypothetical protein
VQNAEPEQPIENGSKQRKNRKRTHPEAGETPVNNSFSSITTTTEPIQSISSSSNSRRNALKREVRKKS